MNRLKRQQKTWSDHVHRLATLYLSLHENEGNNTMEYNRKKENDVKRLLEEEKDFPYYIEEDVLLLKEIRVYDDLIDSDY